jgi:hypothetical protein
MGRNAIMSMPLADALAQVDLEMGRVYRCKVLAQAIDYSGAPAFALLPINDAAANVPIQG